MSVHEQAPSFTKWIAGFHGTREIHQDGIDGTFMVLDDLTSGYDKTCIIDLKMGVKTWEDDAPKEKIERESKKYPLQRKIGFRLTGMRVFNKEKQEYDVYSKEYGYSLTEATLPDMFATYFSPVKEEYKRGVIEEVIRQIESILSWFESDGHLLFICTSILIIIEGNTESEYRPIVRICDFAHVKQLPENNHDEGFIVGLKWVLMELQKLLKQ